MFRVPDSDDYTNDSNTSRISISEDDSTDEEKTVASNSKKSSSDYETCESQENQTMTDQICQITTFGAWSNRVNPKDIQSNPANNHVNMGP
ncbi:hypothetical protein GcC1_089026 [Golovinomyces cichoracearum]|uniref:Uncharacterized protein n=1 Tax=Golovinomyces cichoracearum TaxID=62708 RepID=A0A420IG18_9PEZI|nr:hypothetical protein GcC1_089026 [Golovinomyces cichoracearum]